MVADARCNRRTSEVGGGDGVDFVGSYVLESFWALFADVKPKPLVTRVAKAVERRGGDGAEADREERGEKKDL